ncbi:hypothetical protein TNCT_488831 [Trichonephila clavata]|uniref:Uncharacterized protein n=1 Tax=Trichonephila clavata TaxID=2740835 RepID=A0A8X6FE26_TRICU|nr:hypothetical protein TNCT_488831 [Trichonephila clavata]
MNILEKREEKEFSKREYNHFSARIISHKPRYRTPQSLARKMESKNLMVGYDTIVASLIILRKEKRPTIFFCEKISCQPLPWKVFFLSVILISCLLKVQVREFTSAI